MRAHAAAPALESEEPVVLLLPSDRRRILIVEDEASIREALADLFDRGAEVVCAAALEDALHALHRAPFDFIVTDLRLGARRDAGFQVMAVGALLSPEATIVVLTAFPDAEARGAAQRLGAAHFLTKPVDLEALARLAAVAGIASAATSPPT